MIVLNEHPVPFHCLNYIHYENYCENEGLLKMLIIYCGNTNIQLIDVFDISIIIIQRTFNTNIELC